MGKILTVMLLSLFSLSACPTPKGSTETKTGKNYTVKMIEGCEYIECDYGILDQRVYSLTHKGNCKNLIHKCGNQ